MIAQVPIPGVADTAGAISWRASAQSGSSFVMLDVMSSHMVELLLSEELPLEGC